MYKFIIFFFLVIPVHAEIYKCKDANNKITYQSSPCLTNTVGKVRKDADIPEADRLRAQERIDGVFERERQRNVAEAQELLARQERIKKYQLEQEAKAIEKQKIAIEKYKIVLLERQALAAEESAKQAYAARIAAESAEQAAKSSNNKSLRCRSDNMGGLYCD